MADKYSYEYTDFALSSIVDTLDYIEFTLMNPQAADNLLKSIEESIDNACLFPYAAPPFSEEVTDIKKVIVENYKLFYIIKENEKRISILKLLYSGMDITEDKIRN